jgi:serine/threonine protein kinase
MAPEVLKSESYNEKADLWSLGVTAIELAEGDPPYSDVHPMRAIFLIPTREPPTLTNPSEWSEAFQEFLAMCLQKSPDARPTCQELLSKCKFILNAPSNECIADLVEECIDDIEDYRIQERDSPKDDDGDEDDMDGQATINYNTIAMSSGGDNTANSTIDFSAASSSSQGKTAEVPAYMQHIQKESKALYRSNAQVNVTKNSSIESVRAEMERWASSYDSELQAMQAYYASKKRELEAVLAAKGEV